VRVIDSAQVPTVLGVLIDENAVNVLHQIIESAFGFKMPFPLVNVLGERRGLT